MCPGPKQDGDIFLFFLLSFPSFSGPGHPVKRREYAVALRLARVPAELIAILGEGLLEQGGVCSLVFFFPSLFFPFFLDEPLVAAFALVVAVAAGVSAVLRPPRSLAHPNLIASLKFSFSFSFFPFSLVASNLSGVSWQLDRPDGRKSLPPVYVRPRYDCRLTTSFGAIFPTRSSEASFLLFPPRPRRSPLRVSPRYAFTVEGSFRRITGAGKFAGFPALWGELSFFFPPPPLPLFFFLCTVNTRWPEMLGLGKRAMARVCTWQPAEQEPSFLSFPRHRSGVTRRWSNATM